LSSTGWVFLKALWVAEGEEDWEIMTTYALLLKQRANSNRVPDLQLPLLPQTARALGLVIAFQNSRIIIHLR
jgi:hypothetical protein